MSEEEQGYTCASTADRTNNNGEIAQGRYELNIELACDHNKTRNGTISRGLCGIGPCKPVIMQRFANVNFFTFIFTLMGFISSSIGSYFVTQIATLERQFSLSSSRSSLLISFREIGYLLSVVVITHLARYVHKPRIIGALCMLFIPTLILMVLPHFLLMRRKDEVFLDYTTIDDTFFEAIVSASTFYGVCTNNTNAEVQEVPAVLEIKDTAYALIVTAIILEGIAKGPRYALAMAYIDDNLEKTKTAIYFGILMSVTAFSGALAFGVGGMFNNIYVTLNATPLKTDDPRWVGAWWFGYMVFVLPTILLGMTMFFFPKHIKTNLSVEERERLETPFSSSAVLKEFPKATFRLLTNPIYMIVTLVGCVHAFAIASIVAYFPKFSEQFFHAAAQKVNLMMGAIMMTGAGIGLLCGGLMTCLMKLSIRGCLWLIFIAASIDALVCFSYRLLECEPTNPFGHTNFSLVESDMDLYTNITQCNSVCGCSDQYFPICGSDSRTYYSPCHAGCELDEGSLFSNCSCVESQYQNGTAVPGQCEEECASFSIFLAVTFFGAAISTTTAIPTTLASIRSVVPRDKSLSIGLGGIFSTVTGWFLAPIVMGNLFDTACEIWEATADMRGSCQLYKSDDLHRVYTMTIAGSFVVEAAVILLSIIVLMVFRKDLLDAKGPLPDKELEADEPNEYTNELDITDGSKADLPEQTRF